MWGELGPWSGPEEGLGEQMGEESRTPRMTGDLRGKDLSVRLLPGSSLLMNGVACAPWAHLRPGLRGLSCADQSGSIL